jgi:serine/threonine-protein kinase
MQLGTVLDDRWQIVRLVAEGATGTVWAARDAQGGPEVAIKGVSLERAGWRAEVRDRFLQEAKLLALTPHQHLVGIRGSGETLDGILYLVLDLLQGETLAERIARSPRMGWREAGSIALGIARGLAALHAQGIVHRDIKPANVILHQVPGARGEPVPKIIDLGISKVRAAAADPALWATLTSTGQVLGTPQYMSHEQALGERDVDARSDVWSLGVVAYEMLAGRRPFEAANVNAVLAAIRRSAPAPLAEAAPGTPAALAAVVERCLRPDREERFADADELARALQRALRRPAIARAGMAAAVIVGVASAALVLGQRSGPPPEPQRPEPAVVEAPSLAAAPADPPRAAPDAPEPAPAPAEADAPAPAAAPAAAPAKPNARPAMAPARAGRPRPPVTRVDDPGL